MEGSIMKLSKMVRDHGCLAKGSGRFGAVGVTETAFCTDTGRKGRSSVQTHHWMWKRLNTVGYEQVTLQAKQNGWFADGVGVWLGIDEPVRYQYWVQTDQWWRTREVVVCLQNQEDLAPIRLISDGTGHWRDAFGRSVPALDGCVDVDLNITPLTHTIAIRRLSLYPTDTEMIRVAHVDVPNLCCRSVFQRYTCLSRTADGAIYRCEGLDTGFSGELRVDADGGVIDCPGWFERVWGKTTLSEGGALL
jgi:hypothetical protein